MIFIYSSHFQLGWLNSSKIVFVTDKQLFSIVRLAQMPEQAEKASMKELKRLRKMPQQMPEHAMIRNYLDLMIELPWSKASKDTLDISQAR